MATKYIICSNKCCPSPPQIQNYPSTILLTIPRPTQIMAVMLPHTHSLTHSHNSCLLVALPPPTPLQLLLLLLLPPVSLSLVTSPHQRCVTRFPDCYAIGLPPCPHRLRRVSSSRLCGFWVGGVANLAHLQCVAWWCALLPKKCFRRCIYVLVALEYWHGAVRKLYRYYLFFFHLI